MKQFNFKTLLIKQICKEFAMTVPATRKALKAYGIMNEDGSPANPDFAIEGVLTTGKIYYRWNAEVVRDAFNKAGLSPDRLSCESFLLNRYQREDKLDTAFFEMGNAAGLGDIESPQNEEVEWACRVHASSEFNDIHAIGGPCAIQMISNKDEAANFLKKLRDVEFRYKNACLSIARGKAGKDEIEFQSKVIEAISSWLTKLFF